ncbi:MAG: hypothetical protein HY204_11525 [Nitrospirae bacterium]|nr:hypothetical protein [Nitrospirota bacterium]
MRCPRCKGLMVDDWFQDIYDEAGQMRFKGYRCTTCGEVLDPVILHNRQVGPEGIPGRRRRRLSPAGVS